MKKVTDYYPKYNNKELVKWIDGVLNEMDKPDGVGLGWCKSYDAGFIRGLKEVKNRIKLEEE